MVYSQGCYSIGGYEYADNFTLYVELTEKWIDYGSNTSYVDYNVYCQSSGSGSLNANHYKYFTIDGGEKINVTERVNVSSPNAYIYITSGTIGPLYHDASGNRNVGFYAEITASSYGIGASISGTFTLSQIPRYTTVYNSARGRTLNSISVNWSTTDARDWTQYSLDGSEWRDAYDTVAGDNKSGYYTISGLEPARSYSVKTRCRRADSGLWSEASIIRITTYDIAKIAYAPDINLGSNATINISNPGNANIQYFVEILNPTQSVLIRNAVTGSNTITFSDSELDMIYKKMGTSNSTTLRFGVISNNSYWNWVDKTCTLTGNQKTGHININNTWKRTRRWVKVNGNWKLVIRWIKVNGVWKRTI